MIFAEESKNKTSSGKLRKARMITTKIGQPEDSKKVIAATR